MFRTKYSFGFSCAVIFVYILNVLHFRTSMFLRWIVLSSLNKSLFSTKQLLGKMLSSSPCLTTLKYGLSKAFCFDKNSRNHLVVDILSSSVWYLEVNNHFPLSAERKYEMGFWVLACDLNQWGWQIGSFGPKLILSSIKICGKPLIFWTIV